MVSLQKQSVASELLVNDRTLVLPTPPLSLTTSGDLVWIALSDGKVEVRNARTGEVVRRFEPAAAAAPADGAGNASVTSTRASVSSAAGILSNLTNRALPSAPASTAGAPSAMKKRVDDAPARVTVLVRALLAVPVADGSTRVWLGLSNGSIEVHEGGDLLRSAVGVVNGAVSGGGSFLAMLPKHTAAVTCLAEFGGYVYSGGEDRRIVQWRASQSTLVNVFATQSPHQGPLRCLFAEGNAVVSGADDGTVKVWDAGEGTMRLTGYFHSRSGGVLALCRVGELMWSGDAAGQVVRWHIRTCEAVGIHAPHRDRVLSLCHVGDRVYSGSADGTMGIFDAVSGQLLQLITDQALGWVTAVTCPAELSRFVVWSASADGAVRCWYQDEYVSMTADAERFNDASWYESGSTPYREFRAAVGQRTERLKRQLETLQQRDQQTMALLRRCSTVFGGGGGSDFEAQQRRLEEQLSKAEERCATAEGRLKEKKDAIAQVDRDIAATLALIQSTKKELNLLMPGEAERILAGMPAVNPDDLIPYGQGPPPSASAPSTAATYATSTAVPAGPPPALAPLPPPPAVPSALPATVPPPAATPSTLGVGGPLSTAPPPPPPPPAAAVVASPPPPPPAAPTPAPLPPPTTSTVPAAPPVAASPAPPPSTSQAAAAVPAPAPAAAAATAADDKLTWTNPHVGNYIQRRYYGATPSLRTTDLMKQERRRGRLPRVKVEPLQRDRANSAAARSRTSSASEKKQTTTAATTATRTTTTTTTTTTTATNATTTIGNQPSDAK